MSFVTVKKNARSFRVPELYQNPVTGKYLRKSEGKFSPVYWFKPDVGAEFCIYGTKQLSEQMNDSLIGKLLRVKCTKLIDIGKSFPMAIVEVSVWQDDSEEGPAYGFIEQEGIENQPPPDFSDCEVPEYDR